MTPAERLVLRLEKGKWFGNSGKACCPAHDDKNPSLSLKDGDDGRLLLHCHAGCTFEEIIDACRRRGLVDDTGDTRHDVRRDRPRRAPKDDNKDYALRLWSEGCKLPGTAGFDYFTRERDLNIRLLGDLSHCLRWHERHRMVMALMTDPVTNVPTGIERTLLGDGKEIERRSLGNKGVVRLTPDEDVSLGLGIGEGVEDGLRILLSPWAPIWVTCGADGIGNFPLLTGIETLTIWADRGKAGEEAAFKCQRRWGRSNVTIKFPRIDHEKEAA